MEVQSSKMPEGTGKNRESPPAGVACVSKFEQETS
jgi:hypothetical protein